MLFDDNLLNLLSSLRPLGGGILLLKIRISERKAPTTIPLQFANESSLALLLKC